MENMFGRKKPKIPVSKEDIKKSVYNANERFKRENVKLEADIADKKKSINSINKEISSNNKELKSIDINIQETKKAAIVHRDEVRKQSVKLAKIKAQMLSVLTEQDVAQSNLDKLSKESDILDKNITKMNSDLAIVSALKSEIKLLKDDKKSGLKELDEVKNEAIGIKKELSTLRVDVVIKKKDHKETISKLDLEIEDKELSLSKVDGEYVIKMAELNTKLSGLKDYTKEKEQEAEIIESLVKQREHAYIDIETKFKQAENALIYAKELTDKEIERERIEKEKIREKFKQWKIGALEEVARLKLKKKIENIDKAGLMEIFNG